MRMFKMKVVFLVFVLILSFCVENEAEKNLEIEKCVMRRISKENEILQHEDGRRKKNNFNKKDDTSNRMDLSERQMKSLNQSIFERVSRVSEIAILDVSINRIDEISNGTFRELSNLQMLSMRMNFMKILNSSSFDGLMMLKELDLSRNTISDISPKTFSQMVNLVTIDLSENCIFHLPEYVFFRNVHLANFHLANNQISHLPHLMPTNQFILNMNFSTNDFTNMSSFLPYTNLVSLDISHNPLSPKEMNTVFSEARKDAIKSELKSKLSSSTSSSSSSEDENEIQLNKKRNPSVDYSRKSFKMNESNAVMGRELSYGRESKKNRTKMSLMDEEISINSTTIATSEDAKVDPIVDRRTRNSINNRNTIEQWDRLMRLSRVNQMEYFTCRNCTLVEMTFLEHFTELRYIDVTSNFIQSLVPTKKLQFLEKLILTNNRITTINFSRMLYAWPTLVMLEIDGNPMSCAFMSHMKHRASNLNRNFQLRIDKKCKNMINKMIR